jgi:hypothetical protein
MQTLGATLDAALGAIGERLGLSRALADGSPETPRELAERTGTSERYVREWLNAQAAGGRVSYADGRYAAITGAAHGHGLLFRADYEDNLARTWLPALEATPRAGARVGVLGDGRSLMAAACPAATVEAFALTGGPYDFVTTFDCLHDMGDPVGVARDIRSALAADGTWLIVEPFAGDRVEDNLNPIAHVYYAISTLVCTPASLSQDVGLALGAQAGGARLRDVVILAGFERFRRVAETPWHLVLEVRP